MPSRAPASAWQKIVGEGLTFDDVLLLPRLATFGRDAADTTATLHPTITLKLPILSSPMDTVTGEAMATAMAEAGGLGIIHRNLSVADQTAEVKAVKKKGFPVGAAVGVGPDFAERVTALVAAEADVLVIDTAHGHSTLIIEAVKAIKKRSKAQVVMAGNVATVEGAKALAKAGADILRVGMGPGSICTTRIITGMGVPQVTAILEAVSGVAGTKTTIVADGGIRQMGDMAKALACGAHAVMLGSMLAGFDESPGRVISVEGRQFKEYCGMGSVAAMKRGGAERYGQSEAADEKRLIAEGVEGLVPYKGPVADFLYQAAGSLRSSLYYVGSPDLAAFRRGSRFIRITQASLLESHPHTITVERMGGNYMA